MTRAFWQDLLERAVSTFAQALLGAGAVLSFDTTSLKIAGVAAAAAVLKGIVASQVGAPDSASLLPEPAPKVSQDWATTTGPDAPAIVTSPVTPAGA